MADVTFSFICPLDCQIISYPCSFLFSLKGISLGFLLHMCTGCGLLLLACCVFAWHPFWPVPSLELAPCSEVKVDPPCFSPIILLRIHITPFPPPPPLNKRERMAWCREGAAAPLLSSQVPQKPGPNACVSVGVPLDKIMNCIFQVTPFSVPLLLLTYEATLSGIDTRQRTASPFERIYGRGAQITSCLVNSESRSP